MSVVSSTSRTSGEGSFVTQKVYSSPSIAVEALYLKPYGNTATYMQIVTAQKATIVLEGGVYQGAASARQSFLVDLGAFKFGEGVKY